MTAAIFVPGVIAPAAIRYAPLQEELPGIHLHELSLYAGDAPPPDYAVETEIAAIAATADRAGLARFHLYGHSGGGACALAFVAAHPERVLSLALDEPATDFSDDDRGDPYWREIEAAGALPGPEAMAAFQRLQLASGVELPARTGPPPPWFGKRAAGIRVLPLALARHRVDPARYRAFARPVLATRGSLSHPRWAAMSARLAAWFPDFRDVVFDGLHHFNTSHQAEPTRTAAMLRELWA